ncbi:DUF3419 family protein [Fibrella aquatilis]|uniref:DUF3419 family protein n=1 Tax=Fibrella aquatilis TaxID=2817059 RepID=A0A939G8F6_9BACT|nr:DUF3419 family protein [Fibrella aquatilis]MBO0933781.1 DUF3419 family protein [Fibrella aquatilis]
MHSEFYNVALDRLRYSLVWEDHPSLYSSLAIQPHDRVLVITSAGCNVLNTLLKSPRQVIAIDLNPVQNALLSFKTHLILHHEYGVFRTLMGFDGPDKVAQTFGQVAPTLPADWQGYWRSFFEVNPGGMLLAGKLEAYITGFFATLPAALQQQLWQLIRFGNVVEQWDFFVQHLHGGTFQQRFIAYFDAANLSKGRSPSLFKYAQESGGEAFYRRLCQQVETSLVRDNFFFRFFFFGPEHLPESILPACYQSANFTLLRLQLDRLTIVEGEAIDYLLSAKGNRVTKASLSNIFEYTSQAEFRRVCQLLHEQGHFQLRFVFWNLLQEQGAFLAEDGWTDVPVATHLQPDTTCFYFLNRRVVARTPDRSDGSAEPPSPQPE